MTIVIIAIFLNILLWFILFRTYPPDMLPWFRLNLDLPFIRIETMQFARTWEYASVTYLGLSITIHKWHFNFRLYAPAQYLLKETKLKAAKYGVKETIR